MHDIAPVAEDKHGAQLVADYLDGRLTVEQLVQLALAVGRVQGVYMSAKQIAHEAGIVCDFNQTRREKVNHEQ